MKSTKESWPWLIMPLAEVKQNAPEVVDRLLQARSNNRMAHAYLFVSDDETFLEDFARHWIQACACLQPTAAGDACTTCEPCRKIAGGYYPDMFTLRPRSRSRQILVDEMREFEHSFSLTARQGRLKVGLIVEADRLNQQAQNAFLKTLEEPPPRSLLVLLSTQPRGLLPTIRSRCQIISLLKNQRSYSFAIKCELFPELAKLKPDAGAAVALAVSHRVQQVFAALRSQAEQTVDEHDGNELAQDLDARLRKHQEQLRQARIQAEYLRLRNEVTEAIQVWFLQQLLLTSQIPSTVLPHPEIIDATDTTLAELAGMPWPQASQNATLANELIEALTSNVDERLALDVFCLGICRKSSK
jgi:DNA polymerase-3 subunit delta'